MIDANWLRALGATRLGALLERRPDTLAAPEPGSLDELADRLDQPHSVIAALRRLDRPTLQVAEALAALGGEAERADLDRLLIPAATGDTPPAAAVDRALDTLRDHALSTGRERPCLVEVVRGAWEAPLGLGVPVTESLRHSNADDLRAYVRNLGLKPAGRKAELLAQVVAALRDPNLVRRVVAAAPPQARTLLIETALSGEPVQDASHYIALSHPGQRGPVQWAVARGLLVSAGGWGSGLIMPAEAALALRGPDWTAPFDPVPPGPPTTAVTPETVTRDAAASGAAALRLVAAICDEAGRNAVAVLKAGGVGTRELRRLAKRTGSDEPGVRLGLALAQHAGLLIAGPDGMVPTSGYDDWLRGEPAQRLTTLLTAWWTLPYAPTAETDGGWTAVPRWSGVPQLRAAVLATAATLAATADVVAQPPPPTADPAEQPLAVTDPAALADLVLWRRPYAFGGPEPQRNAAACWAEAALVGAVGAGAVGPAGLALISGGDVAGALADLGGTERSVRIQADLTAVVAGTPSAELTELLDEAADRESRGTASTWRFTPGSVRRAFDAGRTADDLLDELAAVAIGGVPQPLEYLLRDVTRRHGAVRGQEVACCLRADDPALLAEIAADRRLRGLGLRVLAPTVLAGAKPLTETLAGLRAAGYAPLAEQPDGTPVLERVSRRRAATPSRPARSKSTVPVARKGGAGRERTAAPPTPAELARTLLDRPDRAAVPASPSFQVVRDGARQLSEGPARILAHAIDTGAPVRIDYVNQAGNVSSRVIEEIDLSGGTVLAWCRLRQDERMFSLGRILSVAPAGTL